MDIVKFSIEKPVTVIVGVILVVLFGMISLQKMPYQLTPTVTEPMIKVSTTWTGATPYEIERDIIEEQENVLKGLKAMGLTCGVVFSNEHYNGDVPYLGGNTNVTVESVQASSVRTVFTSLLASREDMSQSSSLAVQTQRYTRYKCFSWPMRTILLRRSGSRT